MKIMRKRAQGSYMGSYAARWALKREEKRQKGEE